MNNHQAFVYREENNNRDGPRDGAVVCFCKTKTIILFAVNEQNIRHVKR